MAKSSRRVRIFSALEVANICGVVNQTAINWIRNGHLKAFITPGGQYRVYAKDLAAFLEKRGMRDSGEALHAAMENANWNILLIAAEAQENTFLKAKIEKLFPEFEIIQALDWFDVGRKITEEKPGIVLLDAGLPGVDIAKFINTVKRDPVLGKPRVLLLTAGNSGAEKNGGGNPAETPLDADAVFVKPLDFTKLKPVIGDFEKQLDTEIIV